MEVNLSDEHNNILPYFVIDQLFMQQSRHFWARGYMAISSGNITDEIIQQYIDEQEGEPINEDDRFPIDSTL